MVESSEKIGSGLFADDAAPLIPQYYLNCMVYSKDRPYQLL
jgi:hypothetical protein